MIVVKMRSECGTVVVSGGAGSHESRCDAALQRPTARGRALLHERSAPPARRRRDARELAETALASTTTVNGRSHHARIGAFEL